MFIRKYPFFRMAETTGSGRHHGTWYLRFEAECHVLRGETAHEASRSCKINPPFMFENCRMQLTSSNRSTVPGQTKSTAAQFAKIAKLYMSMESALTRLRFKNYLFIHTSLIHRF